MSGSKLVPMTKATGFAALPEMVEQRAGHRALLRVFRAQNIPLEILDNRETRLPVGAMKAVFENAAHAVGDRTFGLDVGLAMPHGEFGLWMQYSVTAATLGEGLLRVSRTAHHQQSGGNITLEFEGRHAIWRYYPPKCDAPNMQHSDHVIGPMLSFLSAFLGPGLRPAWVELAYSRDPLAHLVEDRFDCPVRFGQHAVGVAFDAALLNSPRPTLSQAGRASQVTMLDVQASEAKPLYDEPVHSIASILTLRLMAGQSDMEGTAQAAGFGVQAMQRMLRREGTSYRSVLEATRCLRAKALLRETPLSVTEIGLSLGYSDHANFTRAFTRWVGHPPNIFRKQIPISDRPAGR